LINIYISILGKHWKIKDTSNYSKANKEKWKNPEYRDKVCKGVSKGLHGNTNTLGKHWKLSKVFCENRSRKQIGMKKSEKTKRKIGKTNSIVIKEKWKDPDYARRVLTVNTPNKSEITLNSFLQKTIPNEYKFVGDGEFILEGKCPDFLNVNGKKKLIELFGNYWHGEDRTGKTKKESEDERINYFKKFGFKTLIIWESELQDLSVLKNKILNFNSIV